MTACAKQVKQYLDNPASYSPNTRAHVACQGAWHNMVKLAKLYGSSFDHPARETQMREIEEELITGTLLGNALSTLSAA